jgi:hypothetical protein
MQEWEPQEKVLKMKIATSEAGVRFPPVYGSCWNEVASEKFRKWRLSSYSYLLPPTYFLRASRGISPNESGNVRPTRLRESLTFVTLPETTVTSNKSYSYLHWVTIELLLNMNPLPTGTPATSHPRRCRQGPLDPGGLFIVIVVVVHHHRHCMPPPPVTIMGLVVAWCRLPPPSSSS